MLLLLQLLLLAVAPVPGITEKATHAAAVATTAANAATEPSSTWDASSPRLHPKGRAAAAVAAITNTRLMLRLRLLCCSRQNSTAKRATRSWSRLLHARRLLLCCLLLLAAKAGLLLLVLLLSPGQQRPQQCNLSQACCRQV